MVTQMRFTCRRLDSQRRGDQEVVGAVHATLGRGFLVLLNGHVDTPKKSVRLAFKPGQRRKRIDPLTGIGRARQTTFFVPRRDRNSQENLILHQLGHVQFARHRQEITGVVFQLFLRQFLAFGNQFQMTIDIEIETDSFQATLAGQRERPVNFQMQHGLSALTLVPFDPESELSGNFRQQIMQAFQAGNGQCSFQNTTIPGKRETVRNLFQS